MVVAGDQPQPVTFLLGSDEHRLQHPVGLHRRDELREALWVAGRARIEARVRADAAERDKPNLADRRLMCLLGHELFLPPHLESWDPPVAGPLDPWRRTAKPCKNGRRVSGHRNGRGHRPPVRSCRLVALLVLAHRDAVRAVGLDCNLPRQAVQRRAGLS